MYYSNSQRPMFAPSALSTTSASPNKPCPTPPSADSETDIAFPAHLPPSPPLSPTNTSPRSTEFSSVDYVYNHLLLLRAGALSPGQRQAAFALAPTAFADLQARIRASPSLSAWYETKIRYDYDPTQRSLQSASGKEGGRAEEKGEYTLRMPSAVHERFIASVEDAVAEGIQALVGRLSRKGGRREEAAARELKKIYKGRSTTIELRAPKLEDQSSQYEDRLGKKKDEELIVRRSPDATFFHSDAALPALVMEVSYSQSRKDLPRLAESYIVDSRHATRCVVGLDIPYGPGKKLMEGSEEEHEEATVSIWRPGIENDADGEEVGVCVQHATNVPFQGHGGDADGALELTLEDLLPASVMALLPPATPSEDACASEAERITIPFSNLRAFLTAAAASNANISSTLTTQDKPSTGAPTKFRKRKRSPSEEELSDGREKAYARLEAAEVEKERKVDGEWSVGVVRRASRRRRSGPRDVAAVPRDGDERHENDAGEKLEGNDEMKEMPERRRSLRNRVEVRR